MKTGIKSISLERSTEILVVFENLLSGFVPRAVGLGLLMLASVAGVDPDFACSVAFEGATAGWIGLNPDCFLSTSDVMMRGGL